MKSENSCSFITSQFVCGPNVYHKLPGIREVKYSAKSTSSGSIPEDLHDDPIIHRQETQQNL